MKKNKILKNFLCLIVAILLSFMEAEFFRSSQAYFPALLVLLVVTVPIIYLYFLPKHETMILFLYAIILVYIQDLVGVDVNIDLFLLSLFSILVLFAHSLYTANAEKTGHKKPNFGFYFVLLSIIFAVNGLFSFAVYEYVLKPNVNEKNQLYISYQEKTDSNQDKNDSSQDDSSGGGGGGGAFDQPIDWKNLLKYFLIFLLILVLLYLLYKIYRQVVWRYRLARMSSEDQLMAIYAYLLMSLGLVGLGKPGSYTELEYGTRLARAENQPYQEENLDRITRLVVATKYGGRLLDQEDSLFIRDMFKSIGPSMRSFLGYRKYLFSYALRIKI